MDLKTFAATDASTVMERYAAAETETERRVVRAAEAILRGARLLDVREAIVAGGQTGHMPTLAAARVFWRRVRWTNNNSGHGFFVDADAPQKGDTLFPNVFYNGGYSGTALVPPMPPMVRALVAKDDIILWEAEWRDIIARDPVLLRPFSGNVYEIVAAWDLTDLERAILGTA